MACACKGKKKSTFTWVSADQTDTVVYQTEIEAKAKVLRKGGSYTRNEG